ncbi:MAG: hypothetical protein WC616_01510 [Candidatus Omnitrophota bacterium]
MLNPKASPVDDMSSLFGNLCGDKNWKQKVEKPIIKAADAFLNIYKKALAAQDKIENS